MREYKIKLMDGNEIKVGCKENEYFLSNSYKRAKVREINGAKDLISYKTRVARITKSGNFLRLWEGYSLTTMKHINQFRVDNGLNMIGKKEWLTIPLVESNRKKEMIIVRVFKKNGELKKEKNMN